MKIKINYIMSPIRKLFQANFEQSASCLISTPLASLLLISLISNSTSNFDTSAATFTYQRWDRPVEERYEPVECDRAGDALDHLALGHGGALDQLVANEVGQQELVGAGAS